MRPSYVLGGRAMEIVDSLQQLDDYIATAVKVSGDSPVLIDQYLRDAIECDVDALCDGERVVIAGVMQHIEEAGIHSGDTLIVDKSLTPSDRQIVVAMIDGEFTVKRFRKVNGRIYLEAANSSFAPIEVGEDQELTIWGAVTYIIHQAR